MTTLFVVLSFAVSTVLAQTSFICPENNGLFPDPEQCDLYYVCVDNIATEELCPDGEVFDVEDVNNSKCKLPYDVDCGNRLFVQPPSEDRDPKCARANGIFDHLDPEVCDKFYLCDKGTAHEMSCVETLVFDNVIGTCVRPTELSPESKVCVQEAPEAKTIDGFSCPATIELGPTGLNQAHPLFPHPTDCRAYFSCFFGTDLVKRGCPEGQVFDTITLTCKGSDDVPECACWYGCNEDSTCPESCNADCSCPTK